MTVFNHELKGCTPVPLAGYLKAVGILRLVAEQADADASGFWRDERFVLCTRLTKEELVRLFVCQYQPTPVVAPWNGGSGFWPEDNQKHPKDQSPDLIAIRSSGDSRLSSYRAAINTCQDLIDKDKLSKSEVKKKNVRPT
jgi:CRISPR-associated protein Csx17